MLLFKLRNDKRIVEIVIIKWSYIFANYIQSDMSFSLDKTTQSDLQPGYNFSFIYLLLSDVESVVKTLISSVATRKP